MFLHDFSALEKSSIICFPKESHSIKAAKSILSFLFGEEEEKEAEQGRKEEEKEKEILSTSLERVILKFTWKTSEKKVEDIFRSLQKEFARPV